MLTVRRLFQKEMSKGLPQGFSSLSVFDIQERTAQEPSPYVKNPSNSFVVVDNYDKKQLNELSQSIKNTGRNKNVQTKFTDSINGLNILN